MLEREFTGGTDIRDSGWVRPSPLSWPRRGWINILLFTATFLTSTAFGSALIESFHRSQPLSFDDVTAGYLRLLHFDSSFWSGLAFSIPLLAILLAHELGHYVACRRRNVEASLPYFLPSPSLFGTFGAFIRIRSPICSREDLFDIGIWGPLAGFIVLLPFLLGGIAMSKAGASSTPGDVIAFGTPLAVQLAELVRFPGVPAHQVILHPMAMAAWAGLFATALNLLPIGQLDGGHILYALGGERWHSRVSLALIVLLVVAGFFYWAWWFWATAMFFFGRRHPLVYDHTPLSRGRLFLCFAALIILLLSLTVVPVRTA